MNNGYWRLLLPYGKQSPTSKQSKKGVGGFFLPYGKHSSVTRQLKEGVGDSFCRIGSVDLVLNKWMNFFLHIYVSLLFVQLPWCRHWWWKTPSQFRYLGRRLPAICRGSLLVAGTAVSVGENSHRLVEKALTSAQVRCKCVSEWLLDLVSDFFPFRNLLCCVGTVFLAQKWIIILPASSTMLEE